MRKIITLIALLGLFASTSTDAALTQLGFGTNTSHLVINFSNGSIFQFDVHYNDILLAGHDPATGKTLIDYVEAQTSLETVQNEFNFGSGPVFFLDGISYEGNSDSGFGGGDDWWHYWVWDPTDESWTSPGFGFSDRLIEDGSWDGWVYGSSAPPLMIPEPGTLLLCLFGMGYLFHRRRAL